MESWLLTHEPTVRTAAFLLVFAALAGWERLLPRRHPGTRRGPRWASNLAMAGLNAGLIRLVLAFGLTGLAAFGREQGWGLFNYAARVPYPVAFALSLLGLDLVVYLQHVMFHAVPLFWRLHRVHHADLDFDVTTGIRFHPGEAVLSAVLKGSAVLLLGAPPAAVITFEIILNATSMFTHTNAYLHTGADRFVRWFVVTPDMHRVHHSIHEDETNSNFGFNVPWWDRLMGTYKAQPRDGHTGMTIGLSSIRDHRPCALLHYMLLVPFTSKPQEYVINARRWGRDRNRSDA